MRCYNSWLTSIQKQSLQDCFCIELCSIGCSLKIHRVEISVADGNTFEGDRAVSNYLIASHEFNELEFDVMTNHSLGCVAKRNRRIIHITA